jgi:hypothetical protein
MPNYATAPATGHNGLADQVLLERGGDGVGLHGSSLAIVPRLTL